MTVALAIKKGKREHVDYSAANFSPKSSRFIGEQLAGPQVPMGYSSALPPVPREDKSSSQGILRWQQPKKDGTLLHGHRSRKTQKLDRAQ